GLGVDDLREEVVFPDHRAILALDALARHPRAHHFGQAVDVDRVDAGTRLDLLAHRAGPRLGAEDADLQRALGLVDPLAQHLLDDVEHVARGHHDDVGLEVADQLDLLLGLAARHRDHRAAELFGTVVRAHAAGEQAVAVGDVADVPGAAAGRADGACDDVGPGVDVVL